MLRLMPRGLCGSSQTDRTLSSRLDRTLPLAMSSTLEVIGIALVPNPDEINVVRVVYLDRVEDNDSAASRDRGDPVPRIYGPWHARCLPRNDVETSNPRLDQRSDQI
jgi:hypothetical protein